MSKLNGSVLKIFFILSTASITSVVLTSDANAVQRQRMTAKQCSPLTEDNFAACCVALNRSKILTPAQIKMCPPLSTATIKGATMGGDERSDASPPKG
ncbi:hypothetical protein EHS39_30635, partial [Ensifer sp. MPMI2T]